MSEKRFDRQIALFGQEGQQKISSVSVSVIGIGGLGTHVIQQLAYLGVNSFYLVDDEFLDDTNLNRYVGANNADIGEKKVTIAERIIKNINPNTTVISIPKPLQSEEVFEVVMQSNCVFGCFDNEGARLILNELSSAYDVPYFDLATQVFPEEGSFGGRICISLDSPGCIDCFGYLDREEATKDLESPDARKDREALYGINKDNLGNSGPAVVSINGVIASLAVTEFMVWATGLREPLVNIYYRGDKSNVSVLKDEPRHDCYYCNGIRGKGEKANVNRYISNE